MSCRALKQGRGPKGAYLIVKKANFEIAIDI
jgi:hypothetical protein